LSQYDIHLDNYPWNLISFY